jgi:hypothetical protein
MVANRCNNAAETNPQLQRASLRHFNLDEFVRRAGKIPARFFLVNQEFDLAEGSDSATVSTSVVPGLFSADSFGASPRWLFSASSAVFPVIPTHSGKKIMKAK